VAGDRPEVPPDIAAKVLFLSDRTCCVCRLRGRPVQIHHLDEDPTNQAGDNLAVLCFDCHRDTQLTGGFDRKLDARQVRLYREDWHEHVRRRREAIPPPSEPPTEPAPVTRQSSAVGDFIASLPDQRRAAYASAQRLWDTGITADMMNGSYALIHSLHMYLIGLASFYPPEAFGGKNLDTYFGEIIKSRFDWHRAHLEPEGPGMGGTIVGPMAADAVIVDLEEMVLDLVRSLTMDAEGFNFTAWKDRWEGAA
jgi:hypothetical protein